MTLEQLQQRFPDATEDTWYQHSNGGGWIQNTARVETSVYVGPDATVSGNARVSGNTWVSGNAQVFGNAFVSGNAQVTGDALVSGNAQVSRNARVFGNAQVSGNTWVSGDSWETSPLQIQGTRHFLNMTTKSLLKIGCHSHTIQWWLDNYRIIGQKEGYTPDQIKEYKKYIDLFKSLYI